MSCATGQVCTGSVCAAPEVDAGISVVPLTGCPLVTYAANVQIGTSQHFQLVVDTGSTTTAVASATCATCTAVSPLYANTGTLTGLSASSTFADGASWNGNIYSDSVEYLGGPADQVTLRFVAITSQSQFFTTEDCAGDADAGSSPNQGITGMGNPDLLVPGTTSYFETLTTTADPVADVFAVQLCFSGGVLWLGGYDPASTTAAPAYTPMVDGGFWSASANQLSLGGSAVAAGLPDLNPVTVDTATSVLVFPQDVYTALTSALLSNSALQSALGGVDAGFFDQGQCATLATSMTPAELDSTLPPLALTFPNESGGTFQVSGVASQSYLTPVIHDGRTYYCAAVKTLGHAPTRGTILGDTLLQGYVTIFDVGGRRIGFAPQRGCPQPPTPPVALGPAAPLNIHFRNPHGAAP